MGLAPYPFGALPVRTSSAAVDACVLLRRRLAGIRGLLVGGFSHVDGLSGEVRFEEYREGGVNGYTHKLIGPAKYTNLRLTRPVDSNSAPGRPSRTV